MSQDLLATEQCGYCYLLWHLNDIKVDYELAQGIGELQHVLWLL